MKSARDELSEFMAQSTRDYFAAMNALARGRVDRSDAAVTAAHARLSTLIGQTMALADLYGRRRTILEMEAAKSGKLAAHFRESPIVPAVTFEEAIADLTSRQPMLAGSAAEVTRVYREQHGFALAMSTDQIVTERVQKAFEGFLSKGVSKPGAKDIIQEIGDFNRSYACFLPGTRVEGDILAGSKARYDGPAVEVKTDDGRRLRVTVNHPVLTTGGWKDAGSLEEGDDLVCYGSVVEPLDGGASVPVSERWAVGNQETPSRVEDVFKTLLGECPPGNDAQSPVSPLDFHGDAAFFDGEVHKVRPYGSLPRNDDPAQTETGEEFLFMERFVRSERRALDRLCVSDPVRQGGLGAFACHPCVAESPFDLGSTVTSFIDQLPVHSLRLGPAADVDASTFQKVLEPGRLDMELGGKLVSAFPGAVSTHRVVKIKQIWWAGHIYDLQTRAGWIVSEGIISSNSTVYQTNMNTAYTAGRFKQLDDPDVADIMVATEFNSVRRAGTRRGRPEDHGENHIAAHGVIAPRDHQFWSKFSPPLGYACYCYVRNISRFELERKEKSMGRKFFDARGEVIPYFPSGWQAVSPHPGFGGRPDLAMYGSSR